MQPAVAKAGVKVADPPILKKRETKAAIKHSRANTKATRRMESSEEEESEEDKEDDGSEYVSSSSSHIINTKTIAVSSRRRPQVKPV